MKAFYVNNSRKTVHEWESKKYLLKPEYMMPKCRRDAPTLQTELVSDPAEIEGKPMCTYCFRSSDSAGESR